MAGAITVLRAKLAAMSKRANDSWGVGTFGFPKTSDLSRDSASRFFCLIVAARDLIFGLLLSSFAELATEYASSRIDSRCFWPPPTAHFFGV